MTTYLLLTIIAFMAGFIQGLSGFGSVLLSLPLMALILDIKIVIPLAALFALLLTIILLIHLRKFVDWHKIYPLVAGSMIGVPIGVFFLTKIDKGSIQLLLGFTLIFYSLYALIFKSPLKLIGNKWAYIFGFVGGCLGGAISASGAPAAIYTSLKTWNKDTIKATLQGYFLFSGIMVVSLHALSKITTADVVQLFGISAPFLVLGSYCGSFFYGMIHEEGYKKIISIILLLLGVLMIFKALKGIA